MKGKIILPGILALCLLFAFRQAKIDRASNTSPRNSSKYIIRCGPDWAALASYLEEYDIPPMPGVGDYKWSISTTNDSAQFYFNQGITMYYSFHIIEAMASFKKAARFDPSSAMLQWAQALGYGPNINDVGYAATPASLEAIQNAVKFSLSSTEKEKMLIAAQASRYSADSTLSRVELNQRYANKMKEAYEKFPADPDVAALYADALMLQHPWDLWNLDGTAKPWTPTIQLVLEKLLASTPMHPGANHYYIHVMEASPFPDKATASADRLGKLTPGLSHTVHMPSHIYLRTGEYERGAVVNEDALNSYKKYIALYAPVTGNDFLYNIHNLHMLTNHAMLAGRMQYALDNAKLTVSSLPPDYPNAPGAMGNYMQYISMIQMMVEVRFALWTDIFNEPAPPSSRVYSNVLYRFARGMALASTHKAQAAKSELDSMSSLMRDSVLFEPFSPFSPAIDGAIVAQNLLAGTIALNSGSHVASIAFFENAVAAEDRIVYNEPRDWLLNARHYLANAYLKSGKYAKAEQTCRQDLVTYRENAWGLTGLSNALKAQAKKSEAAALQQRIIKASEKSDCKIENSIK